MCVIVFSPKGVEAPTEEQIRDMFRANPDGAGYAYNGRGGKVKFKKGFMTVEDLLKELQPLKRWNNKNLAIHFRIGTSGKNDKHTCHPFKISSRYDELRQLEGEGAVLFHNGIFDDGGAIDKNSSDTQDFVCAFAPLLKKYSKSKVRDMALENLITPSRVLIMYDNNKYKIYGEWKKDGNLLVSNLAYKHTKYMWGGDYYGYGGGYGYSSYGYDPYDYEAYHYPTTTTKKTEEDNDKLAEKMWGVLESGKTLYLDDEEQLDILLSHADSFSTYEITRKGVLYYFDPEALEVFKMYSVAK